MTLLLDTPDSGIATLEQVLKYVSPVSNLSNKYQAVQNKELIDMVEKAAGDRGLQIQNPSFGLSRKGMRMFGVYEVSGLDMFNDSAKLMLGIRNSFDGSLRAAICFGSKVFVCSNLVFSGYIGDEGVVGGAHHQHRGNVFATLFERITESLKQIDDYREFQSAFYNKLQKTPLTRAEGCEIIVNAGFQRVIGKTDILPHADEWIFQETGPRNEAEAEREWHKDFQTRNAWSLMNVFTQMQKQRFARNPFTSNQESANLSRFLNKTFPMN
ncbi:MAG: DUF932 domain-containing protein [Clostridiales bacterium]|nr:DUF932 domain-containing protein [Clostridiales bacterium]